jgi:hypothetical protein
MFYRYELISNVKKVKHTKLNFKFITCHDFYAIKICSPAHGNPRTVQTSAISCVTNCLRKNYTYPELPLHRADMVASDRFRYKLKIKNLFNFKFSGYFSTTHLYSLLHPTEQLTSLHWRTSAKTCTASMPKTVALIQSSKTHLTLSSKCNQTAPNKP